LPGGQRFREPAGFPLADCPGIDGPATALVRPLGRSDWLSRLRSRSSDGGKGLLDDIVDVTEAAGPLRVEDFTTAFERFHLLPDRCDHGAPARFLDLLPDALDGVTEAVADWPRSLSLFESHPNLQGVLFERLPVVGEIDDLAVGQTAEEPLATLDDSGMLGEDEASQGDQRNWLASLAGGGQRACVTILSSGAERRFGPT